MTGVTYEQLLIFTTVLICGIILCILIGLNDHFKEKKQKKKTFLEYQKQEECLKQEDITEMYVKKSVKPGWSISQQGSRQDRPRPSNDTWSVNIASVSVSQDMNSSGSGILGTIGTGIALGAGAAIGSSIVESVMDSFSDDDTGDYD